MERIGKFFKNFPKKEVLSDENSGKSSNETFKFVTENGCVETDAAPQPPRPSAQSRRQNDGSNGSIKFGKKSKGKPNWKEDKYDDEQEENDLPGSSASGSKNSRVPNGGFSYEEQHHRQWYPFQPTISVSDCDSVHIGNDYKFINYNCSDSSSNAKSDDHEEAQQEVMDRIKKGFNSLDILTEEDKRIVRNHFNGKWQNLAINMGYTPKDIVRWEKEFPKNKSEAIGKLLDKWERTLAATIGVLCVLLQKCNETQTAQMLALAHG